MENVKLTIGGKVIFDEILPEQLNAETIISIIAEGNGYKPFLTKTETKKTEYKGEEITDEILALDTIVERENSAPTEENPDGKVVRVVTSEEVTIEEPNPETKEEFSSKYIYNILKSSLAGIVKKKIESQMNAQFEEQKKSVLEKTLGFSE